MELFHDADMVRERTIAWAQARGDIAALIVTGSRGRGEDDPFSDFDLIVVVEDIAPYAESRHWFTEFGAPLAVYWDPPSEGVSNVALFADGLKVDFTVCTAAQLLAERASELDNGYVVWWNPAGLALPEPTRRAFLPAPPTEAQYLQAIEEFLSDVPYVCKCFVRGETMPARWCLDADMRDTYLRPMLEWRAAIDDGWSVAHGVLGRGLQRRLPAELWAKVEALYALNGWELLFALLAAYADAARDVSAALGFAFPESQIAQVTAYARQIAALPPRG